MLINKLPKKLNSFLIIPFLISFGLLAQENNVESDEIQVLSPFEAVSEEDRGYAATYTTGGTRINMELDSVPTNVFILNQELLQDLPVPNFSEYVTYSAGATKDASPRSNQVTFRGVNLREAGSEFRDGIMETSDVSSAFSIVDTFNIERVEIIKGPAGVLFGAHPVGGVVNRVSKMPFKGRNLEVGISYKSYLNGEGSFDSTLDWNDSIGEDDQFQYRLLFHNRSGDLDSGGKDNLTGITPIFAYDINNTTRAWIRGVYVDNEVAEQRGAWFLDVDDQLPFGIVPADVVTWNPQDPDSGLIGKKYGFELGYRTAFTMLGMDWNARLLSRFNKTDGTFRIYLSTQKDVIDGQGNVLGPIGRGPADQRITWAEFQSMKASGQNVDIIRRPFITRGRDFQRQSTVTTLDLTSSFELGPTEHTFFIYTQLGQSELDETWFRWDNDLLDQSIFNTTGAPPEQVLSNFRIEGNRPEQTNADDFAFAIQDHLSLFDDTLNLVGGARFDQGTSGRVSKPSAPDPGVVVDEFNSVSNWSFKYGAVFKPIDMLTDTDQFKLSLFFNSSETFIPNESVNEIGEFLPNIEGEMDEYGIKFSLWNDRVIGTFSRFDIIESNVRETDLEDFDGDGEFEQVTRAQSKTNIDGWDLDLTFQPTNELSLLVSLQDLDEAAVATTGNQPRGVPVGFNYTAIGKYTFQKGMLSGLSLGATHRNVEERAGDASDSFRVPGYSLTGLFAVYETNNWRFQINVDNVGDDEFVETAVNDFLIAPGAGTSIQLSINYKFGNNKNI